MSEEEQRAIEKLKEYALCKVNDNGYVEVSANSYKYTILNLIEKQQKEIEEEKEKNKELETENFSLNEIKRYNKKHYIHKDKIKEVFDRKIKIIGCEKAEVNYNTNDIHYQYWDCFESILLNMKNELLEE